MKARDGHVIGMILCLQALGFTLCALIDTLITGKIPTQYWFWMIYIGTIEAYNLYRLRGKGPNDDW